MFDSKTLLSLENPVLFVLKSFMLIIFLYATEGKAKGDERAETHRRIFHPNIAHPKHYLSCNIDIPSPISLKIKTV